MGAHYKGRCAGPSEGPRHAACGPSDQEAQTTLKPIFEGATDRRASPREIAADILARRAKKAIKKAKKLGELDARDRHKLRIAIEKLPLRKRNFRKSVSRAQTEEAGAAGRWNS